MALQPSPHIPPHKQHSPGTPRQPVELASTIATNSQDTRKYPDRPIASLAELMNLSSWAETKAFYNERGETRGSDAAYLEVIERDWSLIRNDLMQQAITSPLPDEFPATSVKLGDERFEIVGIWHSLSAHPDCRVLLDKKLRNSSLYLAEQALGASSGIFSNGLDIPDHYARGTLGAVACYEWAALWGLSQFMRKTLRALLPSPGRSIRDFVGDDFLRAAHPAAQQLETRQKRFNFTSDSVAALSRMSLTAPADLYNYVPAHIELSYKHACNVPYSSTQARSAYMAEFLRCWNIEQTLKHSGGSLSFEQLTALRTDKTIVCGLSHQPEIAFFLKHGSSEHAVTMRARAAAEILNQQGIPGLIAYHKNLAIKYWAIEGPLCMLKGAVFGKGLLAGMSLLL